MPRLFISRLLETLFRRWWLYLLPLVLFLALGVASIFGHDASYRSTGVIRVSSESLVGEITDVRGGDSFGFESAATYTSREINTVLGTELFMESVIEVAGLTTAIERGEVSALVLRDSIWASPRGDVLVEINASTTNPELSLRLAAATIDSYRQWEIDSRITESQSAEEFFESLLAPQQEALDEARDALAEYLRAHPSVGTIENRPVDEQIEIARLTEAVTNADDELRTATRALSDAQLATEQTTTDVAQRLRTVDSPKQPTAPEPRLKQDALTLMLFLVLGGLVAAAALVVVTLTDHSVRYGEEVEAHLHIPVLGTIPNSSFTIAAPMLAAEGGARS